MVKRLTALQSSEIAKEICSRSKVIPVLSVELKSDAIPLAEALISGGLNVLEVTLRTSSALDVIYEMSKVKGAIVGVGTLLKPVDAENAKKVGARFGVSPGITDELVRACEENGLPLLAGVSSVSEVMRMLDRGYNFLKFFPAEVAGGVSALNALKAPLPQVSFCPTGGISMINAQEYLALKNVICVGGSWMATPEMIQNNSWDEIAENARSASKLGN